jgi:hypothetical protein
LREDARRGRGSRQEARSKQQQQQSKQASITGHASDSLSESLIPTHFGSADGDCAAGRHRKRALILYYPVRGLSEYRTSCARPVRVQNLVLGTAALRSCRSLGGAVPVLQAVAP